MNEGLVSIIIPVFDREYYLEETLDSILVQSYSNWECLLIDDGSTDNSIDICRSYCKKDNRFNLLLRKHEPKGASTCRNIGLKKSQGEYVIFFDSDDLLMINALKERVELIKENSERNFLIFQTQRFFNSLEDKMEVWNDLSLSNDTDLFEFLELNPVWHTSAPIWKRDFLIGNDFKFWEKVRSWQDWEFHIRMILNTNNYLKIEHLTPHTFQRFSAKGSIGKLNSKIVSENRLKLIFDLLNYFYDMDNINKDIERRFLGLFIFVLKYPNIKSDFSVWLKINKKLKSISFIAIFYSYLYVTIFRSKIKLLNRIRYRILDKLINRYFLKYNYFSFGFKTWYKSEFIQY